MSVNFNQSELLISSVVSSAVRSSIRKLGFLDAEDMKWQLILQQCGCILKHYCVSKNTNGVLLLCKITQLLPQVKLNFTFHHVFCEHVFIHDGPITKSRQAAKHN